MRHMWISAVVLAVIGLTTSTEASAGKRIGILTYSKVVRYLDAQQRTMEVLRAAGYKEPDSTYVIENADGNRTKAVELAKKFGASHFDLLIAYGTSAAVPLAKECKDTPLVFSFVYDPVEAKLAATWESSGNNTTGVSSKIPMAVVLAPLKKIGSVKTLAVLYTPGEKNSESQLKDLQRVQSEVGLKVVAVPITTTEEAHAMVTEAAAGNDALFVSGAAFVDAELPVIVDVASKAGKMTLSHIDDTVSKGVLFAVAVDRLSVGDKTGEIAIRLLKGEKPTAIPIVVPKTVDVILNTKTAKAFKLPPEFMAMVTKKID